MKNTPVLLVATAILFSVGLSKAQVAELHAARPLPENIRRIVDTNEYPSFVKQCFAEAVQKLKKRAEAKGAVLKKETLKVDEVDSRWYNPSKYVWFSATLDSPDGLEKVTVMMQKPLRGQCF